MSKILFDEAHSEAWTIRPEFANAMQPAHPGDASYARAAAALADRDFTVQANVGDLLSAATLSGCDVLVLAHPSDPKWERTTGDRVARLTAAELGAIEAWVNDGGGLIVLGETEQDKYGNNLNELLARFGLKLENDTVQDYEHSTGAPTWILSELGAGARGRDGDLLARVGEACFYRATTISASNGARVLARTHRSASTPGAPLLVASEHGRGRIVVLGDSDLFGDDCIGELDHRALWENIAYWAASGHENGAVVATAEAPAGWELLRDETNALALLQAADGSLKEDADRDAVASHVEAIIGALERLAPEFPHDADYLSLAIEDLRGWAAEPRREARLHRVAGCVPPGSPA